jgi:lysophospholipase L1-like esterase
MIRQAKDRNSLPVLGTIPPVNPAYADRSPPERQEWVRRMNDLVRPLAVQEGAALADLHAAMLRESDLPAIFTDHVHPNDRGYQIMGREWFRAITTAAAAATAAAEAAFDLPSLPPAEATSVTRAGRGRAYHP